MLPPVFSYTLPPERIAQRPVEPQDAARMLVLDRGRGEISDGIFRDFASYLEPGDLLVLNDTKVIPARLFGTSGSGAPVEVFLIKRLRSDAREEYWRVIGRPLKKLARGELIRFPSGLVFEAQRRLPGDEVEGVFRASDPRPVEAILKEVGVMPIPPYIRQGRADERDRVDYQTPFARFEGSIAAPTASLHFTDRVLADCTSRGIAIGYLTLHVGKASIRALSRDGDSITPPDPEEFSVTDALVQKIRTTRAQGGKIVAVGTTVARALETIGREGELRGRSGSAGIFITPGFRFTIVDALVTNFHQPGTTHLLLVEALIGRDLLDKAYSYALRESFRFLSYGDGMLIR